MDSSLFTEMAEDDEKFTPRNYQVQLMEIALRQNTIIYLPTGAGKTFIAIMVLKQMSASLASPYSAGGKISFILVNSVALVHQHTKYVRDHTIFNVGYYTGEMNLDHWREEEWLVHWNNNQIIIMTCQIFLNLINNNFIDLKKVNLIIFDECHRGVEDQPMRQICKKFQNLEELPRILGLTATLLNGNCKLGRVMAQVETLETTFHSKVATVDGLESVVGFSTNPQELFKECDPSSISDLQGHVTMPLQNVIRTLGQVQIEDRTRMHELSGNLKPLEPDDTLRKLINLIKDLILHIQMLGTFGGYKACLAYMIQIERIKKHCEDYLIFIILNSVMTMIGWAKTLLDGQMKGHSLRDKIYKFSSNKVVKLIEILKDYREKSDEELCALIFVERRFTAKLIHHILQDLKISDPDFKQMRSNFMVGNCNSPYNDTRESLFISKKNREVLNSFVNKEINVLVSSNVLEEGVDIPKCTLVVKFDKAEDYRSYIQSKGRARHRKSLYYTIIEKPTTKKFYAKYDEFRTIETVLNNLLVGKNNLRASPSKTDINNMYNEEVIPPYFVNGPNSAQVDMVSAISLLCRYCSSISGDQYTTYAPEWYLEDHNENQKTRVVILLPVVCPISVPIKGPFMNNKKNAKRAAAYVACVELHKCGELDDNLLPLKHDLNEEDVSYLFTHWPEKGEKSSGIKKRKRLHEKVIAQCISGKLEPEQTLYLHVIKLNPLYPREDGTPQTVFYDLYKSSLCFGLLSPNPLPVLCKFPLFDSSGTLEVEIKVNIKTLSLTTEQIMQLREFYYLIFNDLLGILKHFLHFDNDANTEMLLTVPVQDAIDVNIDFDVVNQHKTLKNKFEPSLCERMNLEVNEDTYLHKIVSPWYRGDPMMYVVTRVCTEKNAMSPFPNEEYSDFLSYYEEKHQVKLLDPSQPLLEAKSLSKRLNAYKPKGVQGRKRKEKKKEEFEEYLIPELVVKQEFPSCLWLQAKFLPSVLSRVTYLLKLQELQFQIVRDVGLKETYLNNCPPLELDKHLLNYAPIGTPMITDEPDCSVSSIDMMKCLPLENPGSLLTQQCNKDFATKMLEGEYSWKNIEEPIDIEREMNVSIMDIEYYETFIAQKSLNRNIVARNASPISQNCLPAITYNISFEEAPLNVLEIVYDNQSPNLCWFYQALTAAEANDIVNLERLETLGDTFLKVISSLFILFKFPTYNEGKCTTLKSKLVSNKNLFYLALKKNLGGILKNNDLSPHNEWVPPCFRIPQTINKSISNKEYSVNTLFNCNITPEEQISGNLARTTLSETRRVEMPPDEENSYTTMCNFISKQYVSDKTLADCVEALLGAFFLSGGFKGAIKFVEWIGIIPPRENVENLIESTVINPILNSRATRSNIDFHIPQWREFEDRLGYKFNNRAFLLQALTHPSYTPNRITHSYQRLEFLGDAILDFLITCYIYEHCGYLDPGKVTDLRSALVNNNTFASLVVRLGFHKFLLMINLKLQGHIDKFAEYLARKNYVIDDEVLILLEEEELNIAEYVDVPKVLGDIFEALAGAVYLDSNKDLKTVWRVFYKIMWQEIHLFSKNVPKNVIRKLYESHAAYPKFSKAYQTEENRTMVTLDYMCENRKKVVHGFGTNKVMAKRAAAKIALRSLSNSK